MPETTLNRHELVHSSVDLLIIAELGGEKKVETTLSAIYALMEKEGKGQLGMLQVNGYANIFYVRDCQGVLRGVHVFWRVDGWVVVAGSVESQNRWSAGYRVFSRNS